MRIVAMRPHAFVFFLKALNHGGDPTYFTSQVWIRDPRSASEPFSKKTPQGLFLEMDNPRPAGGPVPGNPAVSLVGGDVRREQKQVDLAAPQPLFKGRASGDDLAPTLPHSNQAGELLLQSFVHRADKGPCLNRGNVATESTPQSVLADGLVNAGALWA
jgi:hypothetical protein